MTFKIKSKKVRLGIARYHVKGKKPVYRVMALNEKDDNVFGDLWTDKKSAKLRMQEAYEERPKGVSVRKVKEVLELKKKGKLYYPKNYPI